jgi:hypothetical protein
MIVKVPVIGVFEWVFFVAYKKLIKLTIAQQPRNGTGRKIAISVLWVHRRLSTRILSETMVLQGRTMSQAK